MRVHSIVSEGLEILKARPYFYFYPYFWQVFLFVFGGFIMKDKEDVEYKLLAKLTGIPKEEIPNVFDFWESLFPLDNGWFHVVNDYSNLYELKMVPAPLRGVGVNFRKHYYASEYMKDSETKFKNLKYLVTGTHTYNDMICWNNSTFEMLKRDWVLHVSEENVNDKFAKRIADVRQHIVSSGKYNDLKTFDEITTKKKCSTSLKGFVAYHADNTYDIYVIKPDNKNEKLPFVQVQKALGVNKNNLHNIYVLGTDDSQAIDVDDNIWFMSRLAKTNISSLADVEAEVEKLRQ